MTEERKKHLESGEEVNPQAPDSAISVESEKPMIDDTQEYPLRDPSEDPRWAVRTVKIWVGFALFALAFILILGIFGLFYD